MGLFCCWFARSYMQTVPPCHTCVKQQNLTEDKTGKASFGKTGLEKSGFVLMQSQIWKTGFASTQSMIWKGGVSVDANRLRICRFSLDTKPVLEKRVQRRSGFRADATPLLQIQVLHQCKASLGKAGLASTQNRFRKSRFCFDAKLFFWKTRFSVDAKPVSEKQV